MTTGHDHAKEPRGLALFHRHLDPDAVPSEFELFGSSWDLLAGVFCPTFTPVTELFTAWLPYPRGGHFLEMGCGAGVTAVMAARSGCQWVHALDISTAAVANTRRNAERHGVADRMTVLRSDLFGAVEPATRFDVIYWNSNFTKPENDFVNDTDLHHAFFDPGYDAHRRFLRDAPRRLTPDGRIFLGFVGNVGDPELLDEVCREHGQRIEVFRSETRDVGVRLDCQLLEVLPAAGRVWPA